MTAARPRFSPVPRRAGGSRALVRAIVAGFASVLLVGALHPSAAGASPWWHVASELSPTHLAPGRAGQVDIVLSNLGDMNAVGSPTPIVATASLPSGIIATGVEAASTGFEGGKAECALPTLRCTYGGAIAPYQQLRMIISVKVAEGLQSTPPVDAEVTATGGGASLPTTGRFPIRVSVTPASFGLANYELQAYGEEGHLATQAGGQPFQVTSTVALNQDIQANPQPPHQEPVELPRDVRANLPAGLVGNATAVDQCSIADFFALAEETDLCAPDTAVGVATVTVDEPATLHVITKTLPIFNLVPDRGEPARFGFEVAGRIPVVMDTAVRSGRDYGVVVDLTEATQVAGLLGAELTFWGVPGDARHDDARGWECVNGGFFAKQAKKPCPAAFGLPARPFLRMPTSCARAALVSSLESDSWAQPGAFVSEEYAWLSGLEEPLGLQGCDALPFAPSIVVASEQPSAATPTGLTVAVRIPQASTLQAQQLAEADVRDTTVTLPEGVQLSPSAANGLQACSEPEVGYEGPGAGAMLDFSSASAECPDASKLGVVHIKTPLLGQELAGAVYLASPAPNGEAGRNPFNSLIALYIVAEDPESGVLVKLAGEGHVDEATGQISTSFADTPQVPFEELRLELFGGPGASLSTPPTCGDFATDAVFTPWSGTAPVAISSPASEFAVSSGVGGSACPSGGLPFSPGFLAQSASERAAGFTQFDLELSRPDGNQALGGVSMTLPPGVAALLSSVTLCSATQAAADACPVSSEVGHATAVAGLGPEPFVQEGGRVFITGPYEGAPFGLEIVTPAVAGPFDLGTVVVRSRLYIDPSTAAVTIVSDPLPTQLKGIPLQLKRVLVTVDRPGFQFNPTNCAPMSITGNVSSAEGASAAVAYPFQVEGCRDLPFHPSLTASTTGQASKANGANFDVKVESKGLGQANIAKVRLQLPKALPARLTTLQKACTEAAFDKNPASCPEASVIGSATIHTPVLRSPLSGPAYLVSHGAAAFPDVEFVLQGEGITLVLDGKTQIKNQITYSKFESAPDAPFTVFETVLPAGPHSALTTNLAEKAKFNLCSSKLAMPTEIVGQNGAVRKQTTKISLQGCKKVKAAKPVARAQLLKRALGACRKQHKRSKADRQACERRARKRYAPKSGSGKQPTSSNQRKGP